MNARTITMLGLLAILLSSCGPTLTPFTQRLYEENNWTESELKRIQFYLSDDVVMRRELTGSKSEIVSGEIKLVDGRRVEEIIIRNGTPGVFMFSPKSNRFAVSFEEGGKDRFLMFGPNPKANNRYVLLASDWNRHTGKVTYAGKKIPRGSQQCFRRLTRRPEQIPPNRRQSSNGQRANGELKEDFKPFEGFESFGASRSSFSSSQTGKARQTFQLFILD